jgi:prevent-host-death family protein
MATLPGNETVGAYEAKTHFSAILEKVEAGEEITITRHGTPVARLVPITKERTEAERRAILERWKEKSKGLSLGGLRIRDLINEGRK